MNQSGYQMGTKRQSVSQQKQEPEYLASAQELSNALAAKLLTAMSKGRVQAKPTSDLRHRKTTDNLPNYHQRSWRQPKTPKERQTAKGLAAVPEGDEHDNFSFSFADLQMSETPTHKAAPFSTTRSRSVSEAKKPDQPQSLSIPTPISRKLSGSSNNSISSLDKAPANQKANVKEPLRSVRRIPSLKATPSMKNLRPEAQEATPSPSPITRKFGTPTAISPRSLPRRNTLTGLVTPMGHQRSNTAPNFEQQEPRSTPSPNPPTSNKTSKNAIVHAYYTILRDRNPGHYLVNMTEEEEDVLSPKQYAELLQLACQRARIGEQGQEEMSSEEEDEEK